jgi:hypothetical protein
MPPVFCPVTKASDSSHEGTSAFILKPEVHTMRMLDLSDLRDKGIKFSRAHRTDSSRPKSSQRRSSWARVETPGSKRKSTPSWRRASASAMQRPIQRPALQAEKMDADDRRKSVAFREAARKRARAQWTPEAREAHAELTRKRMATEEVRQRILDGMGHGFALRVLREAWCRAPKAARDRFLLWIAHDAPRG